MIGGWNDSLAARLSSRRNDCRWLLLVIVLRNLLSHVIWRTFHLLLGLGLGAKKHALRVPHLDIMWDVEILEHLLRDAGKDRRADCAPVMLAQR